MNFNIFLQPNNIYFINSYIHAKYFALYIYLVSNLVLCSTSFLMYIFNIYFSSLDTTPNLTHRVYTSISEM